MVLLETKKCNDALDAKRMEREHIEQLQASLNRCLPGRTKQEYKKEYVEQHKDEIKEKNTLYREQHKDGIKDRNKQYKEQHKDELKEQNKKYYQEHKEHISNKWKQYYEEKKSFLNETCVCMICGGTHTRHHQARHSRSVKHQKALEARSGSLEI